MPQTAWSSRVDSLPESLISPPGVVKPSTTHTHLSHHSPQRGTPQAAELSKRGGSRRLGTLHPARVRRAASTRRTHLAPAHTKVARSRPRPSPALRSYLRGSPAPAHVALQAPTLPAVVRPISIASLGKARTRQSPPPLPGHPGVRTRGGTPGSGAAVASAPRVGLCPHLRCAHRAAARAGAPRGGGRLGFSRAASAGTGSHGARAGCGPGTRLRPRAAPAAVFVSAGGAASRAGGR